MAIPESQLEKWAHQGAISTAKSTADSIKNALETYGNWPDNIKYEVYLQGSYKNSTNIRGDSDVDVVAQLNSTFYSNLSNLSEDQKRYLELTPAFYGWQEFRNDVLDALKQYYDSTNVNEGNKSLKVKGRSGRLPGDVVVCAKYRKYFKLEHRNFIEGMTFWTQNEYSQIINYPKDHYKNGVNKHKATGDCYKPAVRIFKNIRTYLVDKGVLLSDTVPSYFLECLLYNVPSDKFGKSYQDTFCNVVNLLNSSKLNFFTCQNGQLDLFGKTSEQWSVERARELIKKLILLWNNWN
ncbi:MAG: nucleotidyltransferase [Candidatus Cloacimonetes bacterium]|nr:nucleotidyltransferase [Candidatus Cloacimonadota bacterium]